ncbi:MAG: glutathione S-transferase family protein [Myxococcales bacterium]|nr:MAG: glutathione S-transferase family protein [Myxococcales bacterium]
MTFTLYYHPLASYCWKVLIALYEASAPFDPRLVDLSDAAQRDALARLWPLLKFPVLVEEATGQVVAESSIIIEYIAQTCPGPSQLLPAEPAAALETRFLDRFFDQQVHEPMQKHVGDKLRPADKRDPFGVEQAHSQIEVAYDLLERRLAGRTWAAGDTFTLADCAAAPALYYANRVHPLTPARPVLTSYLERLHARPSFARTFAEAQPYLHFFPG